MREKTAEFLQHTTTTTYITTTTSIQWAPAVNPFIQYCSPDLGTNQPNSKWFAPKTGAVPIYLGTNQPNSKWFVPKTGLQYSSAKRNIRLGESRLRSARTIGKRVQNNGSAARPQLLILYNNRVVLQQCKGYPGLSNRSAFYPYIAQ